jgi:effector-binding domain-containing protein
MLSAIEIRKMPAGFALVIRHTSTSDALTEDLTQIIAEIWTAYRERVHPEGPPFMRYLSFQANGEIEIEAGIRCADVHVASGRIQCIDVPEMMAVSVSHFGSYDEMGEAHTALGAYVREHRLETAGPIMELYVTDPANEPNVSKWRTDVLWPVK